MLQTLKVYINLFRSNDDSDIDEMISYCMLYAKEYYINDSSWSYYNPVKKNYLILFHKKHILFKKKI